MGKKVNTAKDLKQDGNNANAGNERGNALIATSLDRVGAGRSVVVDADGNLLAGNKTAVQWGDKPIRIVETDGSELVVVQRTDLSLGDGDTADKARELALLDNRAAELNLSWVPANLMQSKLEGADLEIMFDAEELAEIDRAFNDTSNLEPSGAGSDTPPEMTRAKELQADWGTELGQLWQCGQHRVICGDCTDADVVDRLMDGAKADLVHADPPYGMGKEKDGIANDNLYREKLDEFQMQWWNAARPHVENNGSAYIWGNAEDLWRLWYVAGLKDSERLTFRNEVVWDKGDIGAGSVSLQGVDGLRKYPPAGGERCLFFVLGEQGFNNNADNYWEGWEPIRAYLKEQRDLMGWSNKDVAGMFGFHARMASHWFDKSQWSFIQEGQYKTLQAAANGAAFKREYDEMKREYDEMKREFYSTRAYFDNTHDLMTDVWEYRRVHGEERHNHATPKPLAMVERAIRSSLDSGGIVYAPFLGTGPEIIAAHNLSRICYGCEISPAYVAVILNRFKEHTGIYPELIE